MANAHERVTIPWRDAEVGELSVWIDPAALDRAGWISKHEVAYNREIIESWGRQTMRLVEIVQRVMRDPATPEATRAQLAEAVAAGVWAPIPCCCGRSVGGGLTPDS